MTTEIKQYSAIDKGIGAMTKKYKLVPDCQDKDGFEDCKKQHREIRKVYTRLETTRKGLKAPLADKIKLIDSEAKSIVVRLDVISEPFKDAIDDRKIEIADEEAKRIAGLRVEIDNIKDFIIEASGKTSDEISGILEAVDQIEVDEHFAEYQTEAREALLVTKTKMAELLSQAIQKELSDKATDEANKKADESEAENKKLREQLAAMQSNQTETETNKPLKSANKSTKDFPDIDLAELPVISLLAAVDEWQSAWSIDKVAYAELSSILKERGLI